MKKLKIKPALKGEETEYVMEKSSNRGEETENKTHYEWKRIQHKNGNTPKKTPAKKRMKT